MDMYMIDMADAEPQSSSSTANLVTDDRREEGGQFVDNTIDSPQNAQSWRSHWRTRYRAAAIYLEQGYNNEKFDTHPNPHYGYNNEKFYTHPHPRRAIPAYDMVHNRFFYAIDLLAAILLMSLALLERPAVTGNNFPVWIHTFLELICLFVFCVELGVKFQWLGSVQYFKHRRTLIKTVLLVIMFAEAVTVLIRQETHFRITRCLRPIFLIDTHYCHNVRRFVRQIFLSLPPVLDILLILIVFMFVFGILGYYLFEETDPSYFSTPSQSFVSLFVLLTTANNPDVMMTAYAKSRWNAAFFVVYLCVELYFIMNLLLAVVYDTFSSNEKGKFRKLYLHRRDGAKKAFKYLAVADDKDGAKEVRIEHFVGMMKHYAKYKSLKEVYLCFKVLDTTNSGRLSEEAFQRIYDVAKFHWMKYGSDKVWFENLAKPLEWCFLKLRVVVKSRLFRYFWFVFSLVVGVWYFCETFLHEYEVKPFNKSRGSYIWVSIGFVSAFLVEFVLKFLALGPSEYFSSGWNVFEMIVTFGALLGVGLHGLNTRLSHFICLRFLGLAQLLRVKKSYKDIFNTVNILIPRFYSCGIVLLVIYYFFAIIGMEFFWNTTLKNCCKGSSVEDNYVYDPSQNKTAGYYLNSFENIMVAGITLWELMVVNNWYIIMEGFTAARNNGWVRLYFMVYYLVTSVVLTIVVAFILEGFLFRIQCSREAINSPEIHDEDKEHEAVEVGEWEMNFLCSKGDTIYEDEMRNLVAAIRQEDVRLRFIGSRFKDRFDFSTELYKQEIQRWIELEPRRDSELEGFAPPAEITDLNND